MLLTKIKCTNQNQKCEFLKLIYEMYNDSNIIIPVLHKIILLSSQLNGACIVLVPDQILPLRKKLKI